MKAWHFVDDTLRDGSPIPPDGEWLIHDGPMRMCESGLHASLCPFDALQYAPGNTLCRVEIGEEWEHGDDKLVARQRRILWRIDAGPILRGFARQCALDVIHMWKPSDVVREYFTTGNESIRAAAYDAACAAACAAARDAAYNAARAAARAAAYDAACAAAYDAARAAACAAAYAAAYTVSRAAAYAAARDEQRKRFRSLIARGIRVK